MLVWFWGDLDNVLLLGGEWWMDLMMWVWVVLGLIGVEIMLVVMYGGVICVVLVVLCGFDLC